MQLMTKTLHFLYSMRVREAYRFCSKLFCLRPSVTMLRLWLRRLHVKPGFCDNVFDMLKRKSVGIADADCVCVLVLDEMSLKRERITTKILMKS